MAKALDTTQRPRVPTHSADARLKECCCVETEGSVVVARLSRMRHGGQDAHGAAWGRRMFERRGPERIAVLACLASAWSSCAVAQNVGPGTVTTTTSVSSGSRTVVGSTTIAPPDKTRATSVTGGTLTLDPTAGASPGPITVQTVGADALLASGTGAISGSGITINETNIPVGDPRGAATGSAVKGQTGGAIALTDSSITATGNAVSAAAGTVTLTGGEITSTGAGTQLTLQAATSGQIVADGVTVETGGHGLYAATSGSITFRNGVL